jgi:hypothetical protein
MLAVPRRRPSGARRMPGHELCASGGVQTLVSHLHGARSALAALAAASSRLGMAWSHAERRPSASGSCWQVRGRGPSHPGGVHGSWRLAQRRRREDQRDDKRPTSHERPPGYRSSGKPRAQSPTTNLARARISFRSLSAGPIRWDVAGCASVGSREQRSDQNLGRLPVLGVDALLPQLGKPVLLLSGQVRLDAHRVPVAAGWPMTPGAKFDDALSQGGGGSDGARASSEVQRRRTFRG